MLNWGNPGNAKIGGHVLDACLLDGSAEAESEP
jgi:hypothetical protein